MNGETKLYMLTETSPFMMSFVIVTKKDRVIVVDGGRPADMPLLKQYIGGRKIAAWILTHAHDDHISGFIDEMAKNGGADFDFDAVYYHFPPYDELIGRTDVEDVDYFRAELNECLPEFMKIEPLLKDKAHIVKQGDRLTVDEIGIEFLFSYHKELTSNLMNDSSLVFRMETPNTSVLFLGDLGPDAGEFLYRESRDRLKADSVQMAHHGHMCVGFDVYAAIAPKACLWCAPDWVYNEGELAGMLGDTGRLWKMRRIRMYGTERTRRWMDILGVKEHYVTMNGTQEIAL